MRNRPLFYVCLIITLVISIVVFTGKETFIEEEKRSPVETHQVSGDEIWVTGTIYNIESGETYQALYLQNNFVIDTKDKNLMYQESKMIAYVDSKIQVHIGNTIRIKGELSLFQDARNPGNFDQKLYYQKQNIHGMVWAEQPEIMDDTIWSFRSRIYDFRKIWQANLIKAMGEKDGAILGAMMLGEKRAMDDDVKSLYQANGISHVLAISSLHLSFIGVGVYQTLRRLTGSYPAAGVAGISFLALYILMIGFTVSAVRALVMFLFRVGADITGRRYDAPTAFGAAAVIVLMWRPLSLYDGGFWMSFGSVGAILFVLPIVQGAYQTADHKGKKGMFLASIFASLSINLILLPMQLYYFYEYPTYSIVLNLYVIPLMSALLAAGIAGSILWLIAPGPGTAAFFLCKGILWLYEKGCQLMMGLPVARVISGQPKLWQVIIYYLVTILTLLFMRYRKENHKRQVLISFIIFAAGFLFLSTHPEEWGKLRVAVLDVGQGDSIYFRSPDGISCLVDGGSSDVNQVGRYRIEPYLKCRGVGTLDYVFVTHGDEDHVNGIRELMERQEIGVQIDTLVLPVIEVWNETLYGLAEEASKAGVHVVMMEAGQKVTDKGLSITCLQPAGTDDFEPGNEASMVLAVQYGDFDMLLTGDVEGEGEVKLTKTLLELYQNTIWEILKVAHHGSKNSTSTEFLEAVCPKVALISAGIDNRYGHPHRETLGRLEKSGTQVKCTQEAGAVEYLLKISEPRYTVEFVVED